MDPSMTVAMVIVRGADLALLRDQECCREVEAGAGAGAGVAAAVEAHGGIGTGATAELLAL
jgi:hypothetical protein